MTFVFILQVDQSELREKLKEKGRKRKLNADTNHNSSTKPKKIQIHIMLVKIQESVHMNCPVKMLIMIPKS